MRITLRDLPALALTKTNIKQGCIVDTNTLFAASMPLDRLNDWAEETFGRLGELAIPAFTNINIRSEFMDLQRRVLIPEGLVSLYEEAEKSTMDSALKAQLKSLRTSKDQSAIIGRIFKFSDQQTKKYRQLIANTSPSNAWERFCETYVHPYITNIWEDTIEDLNIHFVGTRAIENREYFNRDPNWKDMTDIIGRFGIGSSDAMIVNFFLCSKFPLIVTGDEDVAYTVERLSNDTKYILVP